jgi:outer membrane protein assembly factor BamA
MPTFAPFDRDLAAGRGRARRWMVMKRALHAARILPLALGVFVAGMLQTYAAQKPAAARLVEISVLGSKRYSDAQVIRATELQLGVEVTPQALQEAANKLAATGAFSDVDYKYSSKSGGVAVEFHVSDGGDFGACNFDNLVWFEEKGLRAQLKELVPLFGDSIPLKGNIPEKIKTAIAQLLKSRGIPGTVTYTALGEVGGPVRAVQFNVIGVRLAIQQIKFLGARAVDAAALTAAVQPLLHTDYDGAFVREFAEQNVSPLYWRLGYQKVAFSAPHPEALSTGGPTQDLVVTIPVEEGGQYLFREIVWTGNNVIPTSELAEKIHVLPGQPADTIQLRKDLDEIQTRYETRGYLAAVASLKPAFDDSAKTVTFEVQIREGDLYTMGKLEIAGIDPARAESLKKGCEMLPGQPYNRSYWSTFISKSGRLLPSSRTGWKTSRREEVHPDSKTVDVMLTFAPDTGQ